MTHLNADGEFQSDKYPTCPPGKVPLSVADPAAQDLLWEFAQRRRAIDAEFSGDLETALQAAGYEPPGTKTSFEIIDAVKSGQRPAYDDLRFALCTLEGLSTFDHQALMKLAEAEQEKKPPIFTRSAVFQWEESFNRTKRALQQPPRKWLGANFDPDNPDHQARRRAALRLFDRLAADLPKKQETP